MRRILFTLCLSVLAVTAALAQQAQTPPPGSAPAVQVPTPPPSGQQTPRPGVPTAAPPSSWRNVKLDVTIADSLSADVQSKKSVTMLVADGRSGQVRSNSGEGLINIDARPQVHQDGRIYLQISVEYRPNLSSQQLQQSGASRLTMFSESLSLMVMDGKPVVASQSSDPGTDRKVSLDVTATIVR